MEATISYIKKIILLLLISNQAIGQEGKILDMEILKEENGRVFSITELTNNSKIKFFPYKFENFKNVESSFWLKFNYQKTNPSEVHILSYPPLIFKKIEIYYKLKDSLYHHQSGFSVPFEKRNFYSPRLYLELPNTMDQVSCLLHVTSFNGYFFFFSQQNIVEAYKSEFKELRMEYFLVGVCCLTVVFSIIFFLYLKEKLYLYYALFSLMMVVSRLTYSGNIFYFIQDYYSLNSYKSLPNLITISYELINIFLILYFYEYLKYSAKAKWYSNTIKIIIGLKLILLIVHLVTNNPIIIRLVDNHWIDLFIPIFFVVITLSRNKKYRKPNMLALISLITLIVANLIYILPSLKIITFSTDSYFLFINIEIFEIIIFAISIGYRNNFLRKERDNAMLAVVENLKKNEELKDNINKELEIKVAERTEEIQLMNELLKFHNIELKTEVKVANEARVFQKNMNFPEFLKIFPDDKDCYQYLAKLKWKAGEVRICKKCGYDKLTELENYTFRCGKCAWVESVTNGTLFHKIRFSIQKAFYITYMTSIGTKETNNVTDISNDIELRNATVWAFRQKVLTLMDDNKSKKKHKDGWTHLIEYSINK